MPTSFRHPTVRLSAAGLLRRVTTLGLLLFAVASCDLAAQSPTRLIRPGDFPTGLQAWWKLDEAGGTRVDASGNGNTLLQNGTVSSLSDDYWTSNELSAQFSGNAANFLSISDATQTGLDMTGSWTAAFWVKPSEVSSAKMIFEKGTQFALYLSDLGQLYIYSGGSADPSPGGIEPPPTPGLRREGSRGDEKGISYQ